MSKQYVYNLSESLISALSVFGEGANEEKTIQQPSTSQAQAPHQFSPGVCGHCGKYSEPMKEHYKSDFHRYNIGRSLKGLPVLTEDEFETKVGDLDESISGSEDDLSDIEEDTSNDVQRGATSKAVGSPQILYNLPDTSDSDGQKCLAVYKVLLEEPDKPVDSLIKLQSQKTSHSVILMIGGGHFSAAIISHALSNQKNSGQNPYASIKILEHKTFHRYTTRRKQGGSQSASDNAHGKANSAGSSLRRHNEQALTNEIRELLNSWRSQIANASSIYVRASGRSNRNILMNYDKSPIVSTDPRLRSLPFTTKRATGSEIKRAWQELTWSKVVLRPEIIEKVPKILKEKKPQAAPKTTTTVQPVDPDEVHTNEILALIKKGKAPKLLIYFKTHKLDYDFEFKPHNATNPNTLFYASNRGQRQIVTSLLSSNKVDPTIKNSSGKTAFEIGSVLGKQAFQTFRYEHPDKYDYEAARVGPPISLAEIKLQEAAEKLSLEKEKQEQLKEFKDQLKQDSIDSTIAKYGQGKKLVSASSTNDTSGLSEEAKMRLERERRARAAEARFSNRN